MLHLENFFEKSFALLLTTPKVLKSQKNHWTFSEKRGIMASILHDIQGGEK